MKSIKELDTYAINTWCPGCGNFAILTALKKVLFEKFQNGLSRERVVIVSGIGCHAKIVDYVNINSFYSLHGRVIPPATGLRLANPELIVIGHAGDGDAYGEGIAHLIFAAKRNLNITYIVHNNRVYGLTTGQFTPTSPEGFKGRSTPHGSPEPPMNPMELMIACGATFVARGYSAKLRQLQRIISMAIDHKGFSFIDVLQPCYTFFNTYSYYNKRVYEIEKEDEASSDRQKAFELARMWNYQDDSPSIPLGIFLKEDRPTFEEKILRERLPICMKDRDIKGFIEEFI